MARTVKGEINRANKAILLTGILIAAVGAAVSIVPYLFIGRFSRDFIGFIITSAVIALIGAAFLITWYLRVTKPGMIRIVKIIKSMGFGAESVVENDLSQAEDHLSVSIGRKFIFFREAFETYVYALEDVIWFYEGAMHTEYVHSPMVIIKLRDGKTRQIAVSVGSNKADKLEAALAKAAPWAISGESAQLHKLWKKDRPGFTAQVDNRRKVMGNGGLNASNQV
jgi:hypothetical protein